MRGLQKFIIYFLLTLGGLVLLFPLWWMVTISLSNPEEAMAGTTGFDTFKWIPEDPKWENFGESLKGLGVVSAETQKIAYSKKVIGNWAGFADALANSVVITICTIIGQILSCSLVGYAFARLRFRGNKIAFTLMLSTMMLPAQVTMIPVFLLFRSLGWVDTMLPLIIPSFFGSAFFIFLFRQFYSQIPQDLLDAGKIDGAGNIKIWWSILLPMTKPVIAITAIFTFLGSWNDFMGPLIYLNSTDNFTLAVALNSFKIQFGNPTQVHLLMAASLVTVIPCVLLFFFAQRYFIQGLNVGAIKG
jgi:multiple sugar transport system permease protein